MSGLKRKRAEEDDAAPGLQSKIFRSENALDVRDASKSQLPTLNGMARYDLSGGKLGEGTYGHVLLGRDRVTKAAVAVKRLKLGGKRPNAAKLCAAWAACDSCARCSTLDNAATESNGSLHYTIHREVAALLALNHPNCMA